MPSFFEVQFPPEISYGAKGGPGFNTRVVITDSGDEQRVITWSKARARYEVGHTLKTAAQLATLITFFNVAQGKAYGFRFKDWMDYQANVDGSTAQTLGTVSGGNTEYQLIKTYTNSAGSYVRTITKPVNNGTIKVYDNGVLKTETTHYTVNYATGNVHFLSAPTNGHTISAYYEFDVPCRFDTDSMEASIEAFNNSTWASIPIIEIRIR